MRIQRTIAGLVVLGVVGFLLFREISQWAKFDWGSFWRVSRNIRMVPVFSGVLLIYAAYAMRALRWKILLGSAHKAATMPLFRATMIGFAALALLGRPAEFIRPYLISRQERLSPSSQFAVWMVERIFDLSAFAVLLLIAIFISPELNRLPYMARLHEVGLWLIGLLGAGVIGVVFFSIYSSRFSGKIQQFSSPYFPSVATRIAQITATFGQGLSVLRETFNLFWVVAISLLMWSTIGLAYLEIIHSFAPPLYGMRFSSVLLLMGFSMLGSLIQLPGGGVSQLMTIAALTNVFHVPVELAASCGVLLWLTIYMAPVPAGLAFLRKEHLSFKYLARESGAAEAAF